MIFICGLKGKLEGNGNRKSDLNKILIPWGARRLGEFAIGTNKRVQSYMNNVLFDEKCTARFIGALGEAYEECRDSTIGDSYGHCERYDPKGEVALLLMEKLFLRMGRFSSGRCWYRSYRSFHQIKAMSTAQSDRQQVFLTCHV